MKIKPFTFNVDIVGACNLRCPTCPMGNMDNNPLPRTPMPVDKLEKIVKKAKAEIGFVEFALYNWTEPLLHPQIGDAVRAVKRHGVACHLSTNLNLNKRLQEVADAMPDSIRVSLSGFHQSRYGLSHKKGEIETVKQNMVLLSNLVNHRGRKTKLNVLFHRYLGNHDDEREMKKFAEPLGYNFETVWAFMMPLEKGLIIAEEGVSSEKLSDSDREIIGKLALPLEKAIKVARTKITKDCPLRAEQYALDSEANTSVCCAVYNSDKIIGNFLKEPHAQLQKKKYQHPVCSTCMKHGLHVLYTYAAAKDFDRMATKNVQRNFPGVVLSSTRTRMARRIDRILPSMTRLIRYLTQRCFSTRK